MFFVAKLPWMLLVLMAGAGAGCYSDQPYGAPEFGRIGWVASGDAFVTIQQPYHKAYSDGFYVKYRYDVVAADGHTQTVDAVPSLLDPTCSDNPAILAPCIVANPMSSTFQLPDGSMLVFSPVTRTTTRVASDGTALWTDTTDVHNIDAVRANRVLAGNDGSVLRINVDTGAIEWTVTLPAGL